MSRPGEELATRFRHAVDQAERTRVAEEAALQRRLEAARAARTALLADLRAFGEAVGHLDVQPHGEGEGLTLRFRERFLSFTAVGEGDRVRVTFAGAEEEEHRLLRDPELGERWVWRYRRGGREERAPLFDLGLEALCVHALGLPLPGAEPEPPEEAGVTLEDAVPASFTRG
jgi:hypothetical protein